MTSQTLTVVSSDGVEFEIKMEDIQKVNLLQKMLSFNASFAESSIPLPDVKACVLDIIIQWLRLHEEEEPRTEEHRQTHRFLRNISQADLDLFDSLYPRWRLKVVIDAAYSLDIPDLIDTLLKYTANNLEGRTAEEMSAWLEIPLLKDEKKTAADDEQ
uniref:Skp1_POZ domain-containing protein n=1 Tax=Steinernema glaseri TaxID=37863 RepID=A0A1I7XXU8_9BILA